MPTLKLSRNAETSCPANGTGMMPLTMPIATAKPPHKKVSVTTMLNIRSKSIGLLSPGHSGFENDERRRGDIACDAHLKGGVRWFLGGECEAERLSRVDQSLAQELCCGIGWHAIESGRPRVC